MSESPTPPIADFHTPEELLETAKELLSTKNPKLYRGAVLEALAALESFVQRTVFPVLRARFTDDFADWLENKTKMDFDSRLSVLAPIATGTSVDTTAALWGAFKATRKLRIGVVHGGRKVTYGEVEKVISTTADWIALLGRTIELEKALLDLKQWVESQPSPAIRSDREAEEIVAHFFTRSKAANVTANKVFFDGGRRIEADAILEFGKQQVVVETKFIRHRRPLGNVLTEAVRQVNSLRSISRIPLACIVIFVTGTIEGIPAAVEKHQNGEVFSVVIRVATEQDAATSHT